MAVRISTVKSSSTLVVVASLLPPPPTAQPGGMAAVFADIRKMGTEGKSLKHVTADMKTKNNKPHVSEKYLTAVNGESSGTKRKAGVTNAMVPTKSPRCEIVRDNWVVENYHNEADVLELPHVTMKQLVYISSCSNSSIHIPTKCKSVCVDGSKNVRLILESVISSVELVNCESCRVQTIGHVPCISIDKCSGVQLYLSKASLDCTITTSKSSEMNLNIPISDDGDYKEMPIPEQFVHKLVNVEEQPATAKLHSAVSDLYA
ncbi:cyclase-associated protein, putative [Perkinsus marinus ATCC 50983]|uniref:Cyclase-associated protein, putative n=2 Tax=Perkinsus marinus (strain ATCC 50983 / TXsc) TaxID=423536 RepID=C5L6G9_PERM5|nr:cyclase-associated protein, putative [Perkinsus marinus ATCC 50983]EER07630.1 cyclase-associated protein, putative [Perkinsus marinus ATCC 50983]|eukprot:XP_002775814.1 cyclase-associated protein, putative [Perkinsus marinus ATCC 50983]